MSAAPDEARSARRLLIVVLLAAGCGGLLAGVLAVVQDRPGRALPTAAPRLFSQSFRQPGFLSGQVGLTDAFVAAPTARTVTGRLDLATGSTAYIVARCAAGRITVRLGAASTAQRCRGRADGVIALQISGALQIRASVDRRQGSPWGVAVYH